MRRIFVKVWQPASAWWAYSSATTAIDNVGGAQTSSDPTTWMRAACTRAPHPLPAPVQTSRAVSPGSFVCKCLAVESDGIQACHRVSCHNCKLTNCCSLYIPAGSAAATIDVSRYAILQRSGASRKLYMAYGLHF